MEIWCLSYILMELKNLIILFYMCCYISVFKLYDIMLYWILNMLMVCCWVFYINCYYKLEEKFWIEKKIVFKYFGV